MSSTLLGDDGLCHLAGRAHRDAFGDRALALHMVRALDSIHMAGKRSGLHADDLDVGPALARRHRHAGDKPAAADRHHQRVELRHASSISSATVPWPAMMASSS
jgi:hypothetical protein